MKNKQKKLDAKTCEKLRIWQERLNRDKAAYQSEYDKMDEREALYEGSDSIKPLNEEDKKEKTPVVRNIVAENIEAQIRSVIPAIKVTPVYKEDARLAKKIEDMIRNELDRLPTEEINDRLERCIPLQGYGLVAVEWDNNKRTHDTVGAVRLADIHPKCLIPQDGIVTGIDDMDYFILRLPRTRSWIHRKYGVDVEGEAESDPEVRGPDSSPAENIYTVYIGYENSGTGINQFVWVNDIPLEDIENYQARRIRVCKKCGAPEPPAEIAAMDLQTSDGIYPAGAEGIPEKPKNDKVCKYCGGKAFIDTQNDYEEIYESFKAGDVIVPGASEVTREAGIDALGEPITEIFTEPAKIPYYVPDIYPIVLIRNVSVYNKLGGESDCDKNASQQNVINRLHAKVTDRLLLGGSIISLPEDAEIRKETGTELDIVRLKPEHANLFQSIDLDANISPSLGFIEGLYEQARQAIGITDSYLGRRDTTAKSGVAKQFSAAQSAGRLESKKRLRNAAWARIGEIIFKFMLAYCDERRPVISSDTIGNPVYEEFNRYEFLKRDAAGDYYWNDMFLFSADDATPLAQERESLWQAARQDYSAGTFGDPAGYDAKLIYWGLMEEYHYPSASLVKKALMEQKQKEEEAAARRAQLEAQLMAQTQNQAPADAIGVQRAAAAPAPGGTHAGIDAGLAQAQALLSALSSGSGK